jgi:hypothetical protein
MATLSKPIRAYFDEGCFAENGYAPLEAIGCRIHVLTGSPPTGSEYRTLLLKSKNRLPPTPESPDKASKVLARPANPVAFDRS